MGHQRHEREGPIDNRCSPCVKYVYVREEKRLGKESRVRNKNTLLVDAHFVDTLDESILGFVGQVFQTLPLGFRDKQCGENASKHEESKKFQAGGESESVYYCQSHRTIKKITHICLMNFPLPPMFCSRAK